MEPRQIMSHLRLNSNASTRDIYNIIASGKRRKLNGRSPLQCLLDDFQKYNCFCTNLRNQNDELVHLFVAFPEQISMYKNHNIVLIADCTYKTNRYKMPLLHFIGLSGVGKSFSIGFCFLQSEVKESYVWALTSFQNCFEKLPQVFVTDHENALINAAAYVFPQIPNLICIWHLNKNILKNCRQYFSTVEEYNSFFESWKTLTYSKTEYEFESCYQIFKNTWTNYPKAVSYLQNNLYPLRSKFVSAWTNQYRHLGSTSTSRCEGMHAQIKKYIVSSRADLLQVFNALKLAVEKQQSEIKLMISQQKIANYFRFNQFFVRVKNKVSVHALDMVLKQLQLPSPLNSCTGSFTRVYGLPCAHTLEDIMSQGNKLELENFF